MMSRFFLVAQALGLTRGGVPGQARWFDHDPSEERAFARALQRNRSRMVMWV